MQFQVSQKKKGSKELLASKKGSRVPEVSTYTAQIAIHLESKLKDSLLRAMNYFIGKMKESGIIESLNDKWITSLERNR